MICNKQLKNRDFKLPTLRINYSNQKILLNENYRTHKRESQILKKQSPNLKTESWSSKQYAQNSKQESRSQQQKDKV